MYYFNDISSFELHKTTWVFTFYHTYINTILYPLNKCTRTIFDAHDDDEWSHFARPQQSSHYEPHFTVKNLLILLLSLYVQCIHYDSKKTVVNIQHDTYASQIAVG